MYYPTVVAHMRRTGKYTEEYIAQYIHPIPSDFYPKETDNKADPRPEHRRIQKKIFDLIKSTVDHANQQKKPKKIVPIYTLREDEADIDSIDNRFVFNFFLPLADQDAEEKRQIEGNIYSSKKFIHTLVYKAPELKAYFAKSISTYYIPKQSIQTHIQDVLDELEDYKNSYDDPENIDRDVLKVALALYLYQDDNISYTSIDYTTDKL